VRGWLPVVVALAAVLPLLAGCSSAPRHAAGTSVAPVPFQRGDSAVFRIGWGNDCTTAACTYDTDDRDMPHFGLARNETATGLVLDLASEGTQPPGTTVNVLIVCDASAGPECRPLAEAEGVLPLEVAVPHVAVPAGAVLEVQAYLRNGTAHQPLGGATTDIARELVQGTPMARATVSLSGLRDPRPPPPQVPVVHTVDIDANVLCLGSFHDPPRGAPYGCSFGFGSTWYPQAFDGSIVASEATLTWTASSPATQGLALDGWCEVPAQRGDPCEGLAEVQGNGTSPLHLRMAGWAAPQAGVSWSVGPEGGGAQTPQPYHLALNFTVLEDPADS